ncbi:hypothetical protein MKW94_017664 [Papaver nudicaule]|uniref:Uncharacterized protein n=1 Tax=Papaver nudicaule TaxID=74823 RepID=A0AA41VJM2_PAPNU|nr:hypothetical protein [Papaver nudicaule]
MSTTKFADDVLVSVELSPSGTGENDKANAQRSCMPFRYFCLDKITMLWPETRLPVISSVKSADQHNIDIDGKHYQNKEAAGIAINCGFEDSYLEVLLMVSSFLLSFASSGAFYFIQALSIVGFHDQLLKHSLVAFKWVFAASFFCNFLGVLTCLILQSRREYHSFKKFSLIISNTVSFLLMVIGYGLLISFNIQRR